MTTGHPGIESETASAAAGLGEAPRRGK